MDRTGPTAYVMGQASLPIEGQLYRVLFVCTGNICRSPTAEAVFRTLVAAQAPPGTVETDSAGLEKWHAGKPPDARSQAAALARGYNLSAQRARQVTPDDFKRHNVLIAMDRSHFEDLGAMCPAGEGHRVRLFLDFAAGREGGDVPDPYYGGNDGFEAVLDMIEAGAAGLLANIRAGKI